MKGFKPDNWLSKREIRQMDAFIQYSVAAADEAVLDSGLRFDDFPSERVGTVIGTGLCGLETIEKKRDDYMSKGPKTFSPFFIPSLISNLAPGQISIRYKTKGPCITTTTACASSAHALIDAYRWILSGDADVMIAGGTEAAVTELGVGGFNAMKALSTRNDDPSKASRPFDLHRDGFVISEGAGVLILEELNSALSRGARIYAELIGYGVTSDANHITAPPLTGDGASRCMRLCLEMSGLKPDSIDYINAHGTSTKLNDKVEATAIKNVFGDSMNDVSVSSTKSVTGHLLGAAGAVEAIATVLSVFKNIIPPTANLENPDPDCFLNHVIAAPFSKLVRNALSNSFGFGGTNATLCFSKF